MTLGYTVLRGPFPTFVSLPFMPWLSSFSFLVCLPPLSRISCVEKPRPWFESSGNPDVLRACRKANALVHALTSIDRSDFLLQSVLLSYVMFQVDFQYCRRRPKGAKTPAKRNLDFSSLSYRPRSARP